jgi:hypothetical protein
LVWETPAITVLVWYPASRKFWPFMSDMEEGFTAAHEAPISPEGSSSFADRVDVL